MFTKIKTLIIIATLVSPIVAQGSSLTSIIKELKTLTQRKHISFDSLGNKDEGPPPPKVQVMQAIPRETGNQIPVKAPENDTRINSHNSYAAHNAAYAARKAKMDAWLNPKHEDPKQVAFAKAMFNPHTMLEK